MHLKQLELIFKHSIIYLYDVFKDKQPLPDVIYVPFEDVGHRAESVTMFQPWFQLPVWCQTVWPQLQFVILVVRFAGWIWTAKAPTSQHLALRNMTNIEHRSLFQLLQNMHPWDAEGLGKRRPDCMLRPACDRVTSQKTAYYRPTTAREHGGTRLRDQLHLAARLLVTSVGSLVASCKKWTCPPDNHAHARTFDMSGDILACLGHTDWHYFEHWFHILKINQSWHFLGRPISDFAQIVHMSIHIYERSNCAKV